MSMGYVRPGFVVALLIWVTSGISVSAQPKNAARPDKVIDLTRYMRESSARYDASFTSDAQKLLLLDLDFRLCLVDATTGELITRWGQRGRTQFEWVCASGNDYTGGRFNTDGTRIMALGNRNVGDGKRYFELLDAKDFSKPLVVLDCPPSRMSGTWRPFQACDISPDNKVAVGCTAYETRLFDLTDGKVIAEYPVSDPKPNIITDVRFLTDGKRFLIVESPGGLIVRNRESGNVVWSVKSRDYGFHDPAVSPDGKFVTACVGESRGMAIQFFDSATGRLVKTLPCPISESASGFRFARVVFSPNSKFLAVKFFQNGDGIQIMDVNTGRIVHRVTGDKDDSINSFAFSADGTRLAAWISRSHKVLWWNLAGK